MAFHVTSVAIVQEAFALDAAISNSPRFCPQNAIAPSPRRPPAQLSSRLRVKFSTVVRREVGVETDLLG